MQTPSPATTAPAPVKKATAGFAISLIAGIIDAIVALLILVAASWIGQYGNTFSGFGLGLGFGAASAILAVWGAIGLILAIVVIIGGISDLYAREGDYRRHTCADLFIH